MTESEFYRICDKTEAIEENITKNFFPTVEELKEVQADTHPERVLPLLSYFASNPFSRQDNALKNYNEYLETVKFCKNILSSVSLD